MSDPDPRTGLFGQPEYPPFAPRGSDLEIRGRVYANTAAKFWSHLVEEARALHAGCARIELAGAGEAPLERDLLDPQGALERQMEELLLAGDSRQTWRDALAELEILGPPVEVRARLFDADDVPLTEWMALDTVDEEIYPGLLVWLLEWAGLQDIHWNNEWLNGGFEAVEVKSGAVVRFDFALKTEPVAEGLMRRTVSISWG